MDKYAHDRRDTEHLRMFFKVLLDRFTADMKIAGYLTLAVTLTMAPDDYFLFCIHTYHLL